MSASPFDASELLLATQAATTGDDLQIGSDQDDALAASAGADELRGGHGSDAYQFGIGSGSDIIVETNRSLTYIPYPDDGSELDIASLRETDTLTFGAGVTVSDLILTATGATLSDHRNRRNGRQPPYPRSACAVRKLGVDHRGSIFR